MGEYLPRQSGQNEGSYMNRAMSFALIAVLGAGVAAVGGCKDKADETTTTTTPNTRAADAKAREMGDKTKESAEKAGDRTKEEATKVGDKTKEVSKDAADKTKEAAKATADKVEAGAEKVKDKAKDLINSAK
jgi:gas vesicle protein